MATEKRTFRPGALPRDIQQLGIRRTGSTDDLYLSGNPNNFKLTPQSISDALMSGGRQVDSESIPTSYAWEWDMGGEPLHMLGIMLGQSVRTTGSGSTRVDKLTIRNDISLPSFEAHAVSRSTDGGNLLGILKRCTLGTLNLDRDYGRFQRTPASGVAVDTDDIAGDLGLWRAIEADYNLTGIEESTVEVANRPFGQRRAAMAATWYDAHVWDYYAWQEPATKTGSATAESEGAKTAIDLSDPVVSASTLVVSKQANLSSPISTANRTISTSQASQISSAAIATLDNAVGIQVPTTDILPGTLRVTIHGTGGTGDYTKEDSVTIYPDTSGDWTYYPDGTHAGNLTKQGLAANTAVYVTYQRAFPRVVFESGAAVSSGDTVYWSYKPCQELVTRHVGGLSSMAAYVGDTETGDASATRFASASVIEQRGLEARWLDTDETDYSGRVWIDSATIGQTLVSGDAFSLRGTGVARRFAPVLLSRGGTAALETTPYQIEADDRIADYDTQINKIAVELTTFGFDFDIRNIMERQKVTTAGTKSGSNRTAEFPIRVGYNRSYFTLIRQSGSANGGGSRQILHRCKLMDTELPLEEGQNLRVPLTIDGMGDDEGDYRDHVMELEHWATFTPIDLTRI